MTTRFTIAIPTHNRCDTVLFAARTALEQTRPPDQLLVLCDGCSDGTAEALRAMGSPRLEALELPKGIGYGYDHRNRSLERATGDAIIWLADDDLLMPDHLERIGELWDTGGYDLVQSHGVIVHPDDRLEAFGSDWSVPINRERLASANTNPMSSVSARVQLARSVGGWDGTQQRAADWDLWKRMLASGARSACNPEPTVLHFRASGREQTWPERVRQTAAWFDRLQDLEQLPETRIRVRRARSEREASIEQRARALEERTAVVEQHALALEERTAVIEQHALALERHAATLDARAVTLDAERLAAQAQAARAEDTLRRIYEGGWWRLRDRLRAVTRR